MAKTNLKAVYSGYSTERLAGGMGNLAAKRGAEMQLRRSVMANLLWEDLFYEDGKSVVTNIKELIPQVGPMTVARIAIEARTEQKLRHIPLLIARELARLGPSYRSASGYVLPKIILRPDELTEFLALYWKDGRCPIANAVKRGLAQAFTRFDEYQLAKYNRDEPIKLRDVMFMVHPKPIDGPQEDLWKRLVDDKLAIPDTWETELSAGKDKAATFTRLIKEGKLGALAFVRNLRNMIQAKVSPDIIRYGFEHIDPKWLVPLDFLKAVQYAPDYMREIEGMMLRSFANAPKLPGKTVFVVDVSGSMNMAMSEKSNFNRMDAAIAMAVLAEGMSERISVYATAGNDGTRIHATEKIKPYRGFALQEEIKRARSRLGGGGIFTRQCLEYIREHETETPDRIIIFSDSQDCDLNKALPKPFGKYNYIVDVSSHKNGVNYKGVWDAEISGWSEHFLKYIAAFEGITIPEQEQ
jgi:60 kDa SS-A/Ro ribonucleoprotein